MQQEAPPAAPGGGARPGRPADDATPKPPADDGAGADALAAWAAALVAAAEAPARFSPRDGALLRRAPPDAALPPTALEAALRAALAASPGPRARLRGGLGASSGVARFQFEASRGAKPEPPSLPTPRGTPWC
jgi:hypothetical protein